MSDPSRARAARLVLETPVRTPDGGGGHGISWTALGILWGRIEPGSAREAPIGAATAARITHRIRIAREPGALRRPGPEQRLRLGERVFAIRGVAEGGPGADHLVIWAEEGPLS